MIIKLFRHGSIEMVGTPGTLQIGDFEFPTIEREWRNNKGFVSCVPTGRYRLVPYTSSRFPDVFALVNEDLGVYVRLADIPDDKEGRYVILIHAANLARQLAGCIAPGMERGYPSIDRKIGLGVIKSRAALNMIFNVIRNQDEPVFIDIDEAPINW